MCSVLHLAFAALRDELHMGDHQNPPLHRAGGGPEPSSSRSDRRAEHTAAQPQLNSAQHNAMGCDAVIAAKGLADVRAAQAHQGNIPRTFTAVTTLSRAMT